MLDGWMYCRWMDLFKSLFYPGTAFEMVTNG